MTTEQIQAVKKSWRILRNIEPKVVGDLFYTKLFMNHPSLKKMFPKNMDEQYKKLIDTISVIVSRLDKLDEITVEISALAKRHVNYGVQTIHYEWVGNALLWTLEKGLGKDWDKQTEDAWIKCYSILSTTMINAFK